MSKRIPWRPLIVVVILVATAVLFVNYFAQHPEVRRQLEQTNVGIILLLLLLYLAFTGSLALVNQASLKLCRSSMSANENLLMTMYSAVINFFGPLQSGPAFRALYLKRKHGIKVRDYTRASFVYYFFYALLSGLLLLSSTLKWWLAPITVLIILALIYLKNNTSKAAGLRQLSLGSWYFMAIATAIQVGLLVLIFFVELRTVVPGVSLSQVLVYTGAANFALFVSLTPGAIGFRESFLIFSQRLHHLDAGAIVAANTIDRAVYITMLLILAVFIVSSHAKRRLTAD
jgi:uncharacterized membrane protein YbhN (UPF0104 family)